MIPALAQRPVAGLGLRPVAEPGEHEVGLRRVGRHAHALRGRRRAAARFARFSSKQRAVQAVSRTAASAAASAGVERLNGPRTRFSTSITCAGP